VTSPGPARVVVWSRVGCHLCEEALAVVARVCEVLDVGVEVRDVDADPQAPAAYGEQVPVVLVDGRVHAVYRVEPGRLRQALRA
jgi:hypothetical protein